MENLCGRKIGGGQKWLKKKCKKSETENVFKNQDKLGPLPTFQIQTPSRRKSSEFTELSTISVADICWNAQTLWVVAGDEAWMILQEELRWIPWAVDTCFKSQHKSENFR